MKPKLTAIVAMTPERIIGKDGGLPWHLPEDLKVFKKYTTGHPIVMGRKTWDSIGKPLPNRQNIVLIDPQVYIIGGAQIYALFLPQLDDLLVSHIHTNHSGDTQFPEFEHQFPNVTVEETYNTFELRRYTRT